MMVVSALAMLRGRGDLKAKTRTKLPVGLVVSQGFLVGAVPGLVGAGGGFLVVPALVLLGGMDMHRAVATSLFVISLKSFAAYAGYAGHVSVDLELASMVTASAVLGSVVGSRLARRIPAASLRRLFAWFVLLMAGYVVWQEAGAVAVLVGAIPTTLLLALILTRGPGARPGPDSQPC